MSTQVRVLLVEDNPADAELVREALQRANTQCVINVEEDADAALDRLRREAQVQGGPRSRLLLLDMNLPGVNGLQLLQWIRSDPALSQIPVIVFSSSQHPRDVQRAYQLGANCYVSKPVELAEFMRVFGQLTHFWLQIATLPPS